MTEKYYAFELFDTEEEAELRGTAIAVYLADEPAAKQTPRHSIECTFQHFLSYSNFHGQDERILRLAYYAGKDVAPPTEPVSQACPVCDAQKSIAPK